MRRPSPESQLTVQQRASAGRPLATPRTAAPARSLDDPGRAPAAVLGENLGRDQQRGGRWSQLTPAASFAPPSGGVSPESMSFRGPGECELSPITEQAPEHHRVPKPGAVPSPGVLSHPVSAASSRDRSLVQDVSQAQQRPDRLAVCRGCCVPPAPRPGSCPRQCLLPVATGRPPDRPSPAPPWPRLPSGSCPPGSATPHFTRVPLTKPLPVPSGP